MLSLMPHIVIFLGLLLGTITDIKRREVPDWLNFSLIGAGVGFGLLFSLVESSFLPLWQSLFGLALGILIGYIMFYAGQWGGGDAKMIMGLGALFGLSFSFSLVDVPLFLLFIINTLFVGAFYGLFWAVFMALNKWKTFKKAFLGFIHEKSIVRVRLIIIIVVMLLVVFTFVSSLLIVKIISAAFAFIIFLLFYLWVLTKVVEKTCMVKELPVSKLTEGDWVYEDVWVKHNYVSVREHLLALQERSFNEQLIYDTLLSWFRYFGFTVLEKKRVARLTIKKKSSQALLAHLIMVVQKKFSLPKAVLIKSFTGSFDDIKKLNNDVLLFLKENYSYDPHQRKIVGPDDLGITKEQIAELQQLRVSSIIIKEGIPFVPSFLIAYVVTIILGNWFILLF